LLATFQADHASDLEVRGTMRIVARDETRHAALSWQVAAFLCPQLSERERAHIARAQRAALCQLEQQLEEPSRVERELLGSPTRAQALALLRSLERLVVGALG
jgi:hypothetical protein